nr:hypothetical protein [Mycobacterium gordonae]
MAYPGAVDVVYDSVGKPETFEVGVRVLRARGTLVKAGVHAPGRWEWSPLYVKEMVRQRHECVGVVADLVGAEVGGGGRACCHVRDSSSNHRQVPAPAASESC